MPTSTRGTAKPGQTVRLQMFVDMAGTLTDPYNIGAGVTITNPSQIAVANDITPIKLDTGSYYVDYTLDADAELGAWTDTWEGIVYASGQSGVDTALGFTVSDADWNVSVPQVCRVSEVLSGQNGSLLEGYKGTATIINLPYSDAAAFYSNINGPTMYSDESGLIQWDIVYGATVHFEILDAGISRYIVIPSTPTARLGSITEIDITG
ncbi:hypothetical protein KAR91_67850 [Candidatus Pacearchaeota archaeon]|nr:hypothetical protein [Candidatus Pacearchaeota archaeon]